MGHQVVVVPTSHWAIVVPTGRLRAMTAQARPTGRAVPWCPSCPLSWPRHGPCMACDGTARDGPCRTVLSSVSGRRALGRPDKARPKSQL
uniref:Uncharacterized protein n=1 Tax=Oryza punctata TaxID=4537 RepID=A0A0E0L2C1_ORYPU